jgi:hypothetical protein
MEGYSRLKSVHLNLVFAEPDIWAREEDYWQVTIRVSQVISLHSNKGSVETSIIALRSPWTYFSPCDVYQGKRCRDSIREDLGTTLLHFEYLAERLQLLKVASKTLLNLHSLSY